MKKIKFDFMHFLGKCVDVLPKSSPPDHTRKNVASLDLSKGERNRPLPCPKVKKYSPPKNPRSPHTLIMSLPLHLAIIDIDDKYTSRSSIIWARNKTIWHLAL